ncbi:APOPT family protein CG14806, mitochondrial [Drosophila novamexicana]|uniref:APOPT family protein CG14806, mitochondrial n=1 Tax=Drosophila novamexicana TaxID=47314 RepID=UPI0011E5F601|nr:APOPT family protein CG14806, mitochondrial [Drosophila novamexicana]
MNKTLQPRILINCLKHWSRCYGTEQTQAKAQAQARPKKRSVCVGLTQPPDAQSVKTDYIGPPDPKSNLRPYVRHYDENETELANKLRLLRIEVEKWNMDFWTKHNQRFYEEKADFIRLHKLSGNDELSADQMSVFYKTFLDKNRRIHMMYNISWYIKNFDMLTLAFAVEVQQLFNRIRKKT